MAKKNFAPILYPLHRNIHVRWYVRYKQPTHNGYGYKVKKLYGDINRYDTIPEREAAAQKIINKLKANKYNVVQDTDKPVHPLIEMVSKMHLRKSSRRSYAGKAARFLEWLGSQKINEVTGVKFLDYLQMKGINPGTVNHYRQQLKQLFTRAIKQKILKDPNPFEHTSHVKHVPAGKTFFNEDQQRRLKAELQKDQQLFLGVLLTYYCFIRNGEELPGLLIGDIDFTPGEEKILIRGEISKNKKTEYVAIPRPLLPYLQHLKGYSPNLYIFSKTGFPGTEKLNVKWFYNAHKRVQKKVGIIGRRFSFYSWKSTGVYMFIKSGGNLKQLQIQLRHHSLDQVNQYIKDFGLTDCGDIKDKFPEL